MAHKQKAKLPARHNCQAAGQLIPQPSWLSMFHWSTGWPEDFDFLAGGNVSRPGPGFSGWGDTLDRKCVPLLPHHCPTQLLCQDHLQYRINIFLLQNKYSVNMQFPYTINTCLIKYWRLLSHGANSADFGTLGFLCFCFYFGFLLTYFSFVIRGCQCNLYSGAGGPGSPESQSQLSRNKQNYKFLNVTLQEKK